MGEEKEGGEISAVPVRHDILYISTMIAAAFVQQTAFNTLNILLGMVPIRTGMSALAWDSAYNTRLRASKTFHMTIRNVYMSPYQQQQPPKVHKAVCRDNQANTPFPITKGCTIWGGGGGNGSFQTPRRPLGFSEQAPLNSTPRFSAHSINYK